ncbi:MAG: universal stress protein [Thermoleophilia bacterium]|nr:universal stress protein [Thermoleophilia bacterium]
MKKILVPVDGSPSSKKAADAAVDLAAMTGDVIVALRVIDVENYTGQWEFMRDKVEEELNRDANAILDDVEERGAKKNIKVEKVIRYGDASFEIIAYAKENRASVSSIMMGSAGRRGIARSFVGSTASRVVRQVGAEVPCPVTIVPA